jgi:ferredoxin-NADP reductase
VAGAAVLGRLTALGWTAAEVREIVPETRRVASLALDVPGWPGHLAGQHVDLRLTADDGYRAERSYSIASAPGDGVVVTVERLEDGEVSPYLVEDVRPGDVLEVRGPIGGYFVWEPALGGPLLLVAGGSGVVPLMAMLRHRAAAGSDVPARLLYSSRTLEEAIFHDELAALAAPDLGVVHTLTRHAPAGWQGFTRRVDRAMLEEVAWPPPDRPLIYVCGPSGFVETVATAMVELGHEPALVRTERFGPTGG